MPTVKVTAADRKAAAQRAAEWKLFRQHFLYSQAYLASVLPCARRTVVSIETASVLHPHPDLPWKFRDLKRQHEEDEAAYFAKRASFTSARQTAVAWQ